MPSLRRRIAISVLIGLSSSPLQAACPGGVSNSFTVSGQVTNPAVFKLNKLAQRLLARQNPYDTPKEQYPLTAGLVALPFLAFRPETAAGVFYGLSSAFLAFGLTRQGYDRLLVFLAYPYWIGLLTVQWSTVITASALVIGRAPVPT